MTSPAAPPPAPTFDAWLVRHANTFGMADAQHLAMLEEWLAVFRQVGYTAAELAAATLAIALDPPRYRTDHLRAVHEAVRNARARSLAARPPDPAAAPCELCDGDGWAIVPHWQPARRAKGATCAVCCYCAAGRRRQQGLAERRPMTLEQYEAIVPLWREEAEAIADRLFAERAAEARAGHLDRTLGPLAVNPAEIVERLRRRHAGG